MEILDLYNFDDCADCADDYDDSVRGGDSNRRVGGGGGGGGEVLTDHSNNFKIITMKLSNI